MSAADHQTLRILDGHYVLERLTTAAPQTDVLATVHGPDGGARMRRDDSATADTWVALWNGDAAHPPEATGMLAAIVASLAAGGVPVWTAASYDGDIVLVPQDRFADATQLLRGAGHAIS
ncbi:ACT domain-containing protein [Leifsonia sp. C5G2]|uniref:ACT domain-containing protein n=1 Tax=Leifsonia sp. C5G2 TaxID=2735269 RepID=UPI001585C3C2|nr:ACT domain-containing protein [Leifsonia sp. C5G2]NUU07684.1 ACT domain-containing protein [Leifsonia sp. C5G2]